MDVDRRQRKRQRRERREAAATKQRARVLALLRGAASRPSGAALTAAVQHTTEHTELAELACAAARVSAVLLAFGKWHAATVAAAAAGGGGGAADGSGAGDVGAVSRPRHRASV